MTLIIWIANVLFPPEGVKDVVQVVLVDDSAIPPKYSDLSLSIMSMESRLARSARLDENQESRALLGPDDPLSPSSPLSPDAKIIPPSAPQFMGGTALSNISSLSVRLFKMNFRDSCGDSQILK
jgi:hypothetical protein